ncbi:hypothetical protein ACFSBZ_11020 [Amnibacterium flavum]|nr:hypothetical protein [Amnibacterium flavum]
MGRRHLFVFAPLGILAVALVASSPAHAVGNSYQWSGGSSVGFDTSDPTNWSGAAGPGSGDDIYIPAGTDMNVDGGPLTVRRLMVDVGQDFGISGQPMTITGEIAVTQPAGYATEIENDLTLDDVDFVFVQDTNTLFVSGPMTVVGDAQLGGEGDIVVSGQVAGGSVTVFGDGDLVLRGGGSLAGISVQSGTVHAGSVITSDVAATGGVLSGGTPSNTGGSEQSVGAVSLGSSAVLSPGPTPGGDDEGLFATTGSLSAAPGSSVVLGLGAASDAVAVAGTADITGSTLIVHPRPGLQAGDRFVPITAGAIVGEFADESGTPLTGGSTFVQSGQRWRITYGTTDIAVENLGPVPTAGSAPSGAGALAETGPAGAGTLAALGMTFTALGAALLVATRLVPSFSPRRPPRSSRR